MVDKVLINRNHKEITLDSFVFEDWQFYWITQVSWRYTQRLEVALKDVDLDVPRWRVLMCLHEGHVATVSEIADRAIVKLPTMTKIVRRMQADGLVVCNVSAADGRVTEVTLTASGKVARATGWKVASTIYAKAFGSVSPRDKAMLNRVLGEVFKRLNE